MKDQRKDEKKSGLQVDRRNFLMGTALGVGALGLISGCGSDEEDPKPTPTDGKFELEEVSLAELREGMGSGKWTSKQITELYLARIEAINAQGPTLRAVIETNPDAVSIAEALDAERRAGNVRGPLHGIPILLKDNIATNDKTSTTAGSLALQGSIAPQDSFVVKRLREAGAVLLGKTNLSEWANFRSTRASSGWSGRGRQCRNPYVLDRNPSGSSSGSAVAAAASMAAATIGSETNGSIVSPASSCGVVGVKPTVGLVSRSRIIPISQSQDTAGPMSRTVRDAAIVLGAMTGIDSEDSATAASAGKAHTDYTQFLDANGLRGARIGVARSLFGVDPGVDALMEAALEAMRQQGAVIVDPVRMPSSGDYGNAMFEVLLYEFKAGLNAYLAGLGPNAPVKSLADVIAFNQANAATSMPYFGQEILLMAEAKGPLTDQAYLDARARALRFARDEGLDKTFADNNLDAIVGAGGGPAWLTNLVGGDHFRIGSSAAAAAAGYPIVSVPAGDMQGLPVNINFIGKAWSEPTLFRVAYAYEQATKHRKAPRYLPTLELP
ncbi:MAG TPA: amidase [Myxococcaceae bacterium]|nr:amidase [Myxococcaceae bacterium]